MEWTESLATALKYIEDHIYDDINADDLTDIVYMSSFYFQKGFKIITGYSIGEYIRCKMCIRDSSTSWNGNICISINS